MPTSDTESSPPIGAIRGLARVLPFAGRDVYGLIAGMVISLISSGLALGIPIALEALVDGPLRGDDPTLVWPAVGLIALLGMLEALFIYLRRVAVLTPGTRIDSRIRNAITCKTCPSRFTTSGRVASCCRALTPTSASCDAGCHTAQ